MCGCTRVWLSVCVLHTRVAVCVHLHTRVAVHVPFAHACGCLCAFCTRVCSRRCRCGPADYESLRIGGLIFAGVLFILGVLLILSESPQNTPKSPQKGPKIPRNDHKYPEMAPKCPKRAPKYPQMTQNTPK